VYLNFSNYESSCAAGGIICAGAVFNSYNSSTIGKTNGASTSNYSAEMVTGFTSSSSTAGYPNCSISTSQDSIMALEGTGVGTYGNTTGNSVASATSVSATAPNWNNQTDVVVVAYAGTFNSSTQSNFPSSVSSSSWGWYCNQTSIWVSSGGANYTVYNSYDSNWQFTTGQMRIATSVSPGTNIYCYVYLAVTSGTETYNFIPPGSYSIEFFGT